MDAFFHKGIEMAELGKHEKALEIFDKLLQIHKDNVNVIYAKARSNAALDNIDEAIYLLGQAIKKDRKNYQKNGQFRKNFFDNLLDDPRFNKLVK